MQWQWTVDVMSVAMRAAPHNCLLKCLNEPKHATSPLFHNSPPKFSFAPLAASKSRLSKAKNTRTGGGGGGFGGERKEPPWQCVQGCGACCKLDKGPAFATPEEIFDDPADVDLYRCMIGPDGWCVHYMKTTRTCSIYADRPYFCRVEPHVFKNLYCIDEKRFNKEACSSCRDTIKAIYGAQSQELDNFNRTIRKSRLAGG